MKSASAGGLEKAEKLLDLKMESETLEKRLWKIREELEKLSSEAAYPGMKKLEGTFWKFRNSYSSPQKESDYWWLYRRIDKVSQDGSVGTTEFQVDSYGRMTLKTSTEYWNHNMEFLSRWEKSNKAEWKAAIKPARKMLESL